MFHLPPGRAYESSLDREFVERVGIGERIGEWREAAREIAIASGVMD